MATADAPDNPAATYYSGRPLNYDPQQAQVVVPTPEPPPPPSSAVVNPANAPPAPPQGAGEQANNHTQVHDVPGYYTTRLKNANTVAPAPPAAASAPSPAADAATAAAAAANQRELSFMYKILKCFKSSKNEK
ncbi:unnamed protein product [Urochloa humidicola]